MSFCGLNELTIENTCFEKKAIHKHTWQHPGSKQWHCIDYVIMRQKQRRLCRDVSVVRSVECWTDHKLLKAQLELLVPHKARQGKVTKSFVVAGLKQDQQKGCTVIW